ncbi:hypothetical protein ETD86_44175 [Nonomuraea turkmeniaca]|uniref:Uncharacterized protein n=1 Tax=Nonomuraea turkmeniaca TaxID=103838 RepID=A0A5S4F034_9ACTN|nr:hypothetical protein [Nonomuraea turkmeniaca]TMR09304.1 hypothetical protein ETD86_44175 [Nonomuraea turkmeniaca]
MTLLICLDCGIPVEEVVDDKTGRSYLEAARAQPGYKPRECPKGGGHKVYQVIPDPEDRS